MTVEFEQILHITDSTIVRNQIQNDCHEFATFTGNCVGEIQDASSPDQWWCTPTEENPADLVTRATSLENIAADSFFSKWTKVFKKGTCLCRQLARKTKLQRSNFWTLK